MQVSVESTGSLARRMTVAVPADQLEQAVSSRLKRLAKTARLPGFRKGKIPLKVIEAKYGNQALAEAAGELVRSTFTEALGIEGLKPAGGPRIAHSHLGRGETFEYIAEFEVYPEINQLEISDCQIYRPTVSITEADIDQTIETIRKQRLSWHKVDRESKDGDQVMIGFVGRIDGGEFEGGKADNMLLILGSKTFIPGFEDGLSGAKSGDERTLDLTFPEEYGKAEFAGKAVQFTVNIKEVQESTLPVVDETFIKGMGVDSGEQADFQAEVRSNMERELGQRKQQYISQQVEAALLAANVFDVPQEMLDAEVARVTQAYQQGSAASLGKEATKFIAEQARRRVALGLIISEIVQHSQIKADPAKVRQRVEELARGYESPTEVINWHYAEPGRLDQVEAQVMEATVIDLLLESADMVDKPMSFQELLQAPE